MSGTDAAPAGGQAQAPQLAINAQYVKDFSFESPNAPQSLVPGSSAPQIEVNVDVGARSVAEEMFEVTLTLRATARRESEGAAEPETVFIAELVYGGLFTLRNIPQEQLEPICLIECPRLIFPFARRIIADATRDGGFPPLMLEPIDFLQLYLRHRQGQMPGQGQPN